MERVKASIRKLLLPLCYALLQSTTAVAQEVVIAVPSSSPPFSSFDAQGKLVGFNIDLARAICETARLNCRFEPLTLAKLIPDVAAGRADIGVANLLKSPEREAQVAFSVPVWRSTSSFIGGSALRFSAPAKVLEAGKVCAVEGSRQHAYLSRLGLAPGTLVGRATNEEAFEGLKRGQCALVLMPTVQALPLLQSAAGKDYSYIGTPLSEGGLGGPAHVVVRPDKPALLAQVNEAIEALIRSGTLDKISRRYFPFSIL